MDLGQLNDDQKAVLKQFREAVKDCTPPHSDDVYLLRWLIARDFDLAKSEKMFRNSMEWRRKYKIETLEEDYKTPEVLTKYYSAGHVGVDKLSSYLMVVRYGATDLKGILQSVKKKDYVMHVIELVERGIRTVRNNQAKYKRRPDAINQACVIMDMAGFSMRHITYKPALETALQLVQFYEANYPEFLRRVFVINAPKIFSLLYSMIKPFMHEKTRNKVQIYSYDSAQWQAALLEDIDPEELPACYGGTKTDPDGNPNCVTMVNMGGEVPRSYYLNSKPDTNYKKYLSIANGSKEQLQFQVKDANTLLKWDFQSEEGDIGFAVYRKKSGELIPVVPYDRVDCQMSPEEGEIHCEYAGHYVLEFDNSFSYFRSKKIWYSITMESSKGVCENGN
ncbi:SEC14-like protein 2 [Daphnia pulicaria]|uniref:SEC14-like protein 2 n=1 Tax=Daphnia pulicaria TaxID=35523 RepID=UPI001EEBC4BC|nr:SEC14-like protein 2 [Daphnia pulicaria]